MTTKLDTNAKQQKALTDAELGWIAGVIDLKGRLAVKNNLTRVTPQVILYVESKNHQIIRRLAQNTGMRPEPKAERPLKDFMRKGCSEHCPQDHVHVGSRSLDELSMPAMMRWTITGAGIVVIMHSVLDLLTSENFNKYTDICNRIKLNTPIAGPGSGAVLATIRRLHFAGWNVPPEYQSALEN